MSTTSNNSGLSWTNIIYDIPLPKPLLSKILHKPAEPISDPEKGSIDIQAPEGYRRILNGISGHVRCGEFVGILGASGAGKTTLLNVLSARLDSTGELGGQVLFDGKKRKAETWKRVAGYVQQDDALLPRSTVRETIQTAAKLRLPDKAFNAEAKQQRAQEVMDMLRLDQCADSRIGNEALRGVSGGERKRTSIGIELVSDVSMLFLDEPTSGLDSFAASLLVTNVSQIVKERNLSCLMTVHQPSWAMFTQLDRVVLLAKGGVYYDGPPRETIAWFKELGYEVPEGVNPADHFISIAEDTKGDTVERLLNSWKERGDAVMGLQEGGEDNDSKEEYPTSVMKEFTLLLARWGREMARDRQTIVATAGQTVIILILIGFGFFRLGNNQNDVLPKIGVLFFIPINASFRVGLRLSPSAFFIFLGINCLYLTNSAGLALAIGAASPTLEVSQILAPLCNVVFLLFGGSLLPTPPPWFIWLKWISPITYIFSSTIQNEFAGQTIECDGSGGAQCYQTGDAVIQSYNAGTFSIGENAGFLVGLTVIYFALGYLALKYSTGPRFRIQ